MKSLLTIVMLLGTCSALAETREAYESKLQQMVNENIISKEEAEKAKYRLKSNTAVIASRGPASVMPKKIEEMSSSDLDRAQFSVIQNEIRKMVPRDND